MNTRNGALLALFCAAGMSGFGVEKPSDEFYNAIRNNDIAGVERLVKAHGANLADSGASTPLMYAAAVGSEAMMRRLIELGADAKWKNASDASALHWCGGNYARMKLLADHGADVNLRSKQGHTPVLLAASHAGGLASVKMLLEKGARLEGPPSPNGMTPLSAAAAANDTALVKFLLEKGGKAALAGPGGPVALINAALHGNLEVVKLMLANGVDVNSASPPVTMRVQKGPIALGNLTPLILAVGSGNTEVVRALLAAGAKVDAQDVRGMTPLMLAVATDHPNRDVVQLLLAAQPDTKLKSKDGETALDWALKFKDEAIVAAVRKASPGVEPAHRESVKAVRAAAPNALTAIERSLPLLQKASATNVREGGCVSCHAGNATSSAVAAARAKGVAVDEKMAAENLKMTRLMISGPAEGLLERTDLPAVEILTFTLLAMMDEGVKADRVTDAMVHNIAAQQFPTGDWGPKGILRPPTHDRLFTDAAFAIRVLQHFAPPARKSEYDERIASAARALREEKPQTTEDYAMQLAGLRWAGADEATIGRLRKGLLALQRKDGGWGQTPLYRSDAYATATALYALHATGTPAQSKEYKRGVQFLLDNQAADGSWHVASRTAKFQPYFEGGFPYGHDQWLSQWATARAAQVLTHALPEQRAARK